LAQIFNTPCALVGIIDETLLEDRHVDHHHSLVGAAALRIGHSPVCRLWRWWRLWRWRRQHAAAGRRAFRRPAALVLTPNGRRLYVANARSNSVSVIDTATDAVIKTISDVGPEPRGLAMTNDGDQYDDDETLYVTQFLSLPIAGKIDGADDAKAGHVSVVSTASNTVVADIAVNPIAKACSR
jgi:YVTN family beta-propeller protein